MGVNSYRKELAPLEANSFLKRKTPYLVGFIIQINFLAERVHVSEILRHFSQFYPTHSRLVYDPTGTILAILYGEVPHMLPAKYQPNPPGGSGEEDF